MLRRAILSIIVPAALFLVAIAAPAIVQAGGGCHGQASPPGDGQASVIKIDGCMFFPTVARVPVGTTVRFLNLGQVAHNVTGVSGAWGSAGDFAPNAEYRVAFAAPGIYPFACTLHPGMNGVIVVGDAAAPAAGAPAAPVTVTAPPEPSPAPTTPAAPPEARTVDLAPMAIAGLAGFGLGAIGALIVSGAVGGRRRDEAIPTVR